LSFWGISTKTKKTGDDRNKEDEDNKEKKAKTKKLTGRS